MQLRENEPIGSVIAMVHATDKDSSDYGSVTYFIPKNGNTPTTREQVKVDPKTGEVTLAKSLDRETYPK